MNKRSKVALVILAVVILFVFASLLSGVKVDNTDKDLEDFENEIIDPNNELDPLGLENSDNVLLIKIALKTESIIDKVFSTFVNLIKSFTEKII